MARRVPRTLITKPSKGLHRSATLPMRPPLDQTYQVRRHLRQDLELRHRALEGHLRTAESLQASLEPRRPMEHQLSVIPTS